MRRNALQCSLPHGVVLDNDAAAINNSENLAALSLCR